MYFLLFFLLKKLYLLYFMYIIHLLFLLNIIEKCILICKNENDFIKNDILK